MNSLPRLGSLRLATKLQVLLAVGILTVLAGLVAFQIGQRLSETQAERRSGNLRITGVMSGPLSAVLPLTDPSVMYGQMEILEREPTAAAVVVVKDGQVIKSQQSLTYFELTLEPLTKIAIEAAKLNQSLAVEEGDFEFVAVPVIDSGERVIGALGIAWSTDGLLWRIWRDAMLQGSATSLACITLLWLLDRALRRLVTSPLRTIADVIEHDDCSGGDENSQLLPEYHTRRDEIGTLARAVSSFQERSAETRRLNVQFDAALSNMVQGLCLFDAQHRLVVYNQCFARMFGAPIVGQTASALSANPGMGLLFQPPAVDRSDTPEEQVLEQPDGRMIQVSRQAIPGEGWVATYEDITERLRTRERLSYMARHDALTGLPNRVMFRERMESMLQRRRGDGPSAVLYLDLDGFKGVNDTLGHPVGDALLCAVAKRLRDCTRETDLVSRLGGDEFAVIQVGAEQPTDAIALANRLVEALRTPFDIHEHRIVIGTSIGIALTDEGATAPEVVLRNADLALYRAKNSGRGIWRFYEPAMDAEMQARRSMELGVRQALAEEQFEVYYQPLVNARTLTLTGFEALVRWRHPERGLISPGEFISLAEEIGLIKPIGSWVLARACEHAATWPSHLKVAVNLSPVQFSNSALLQEVEQALIQSGLAADRLELEITESVVLQDNDSTLGVLHKLHQMGVHIAMDDFGTGYSSLSYLRRFPFDKIKIDQSFVCHLVNDNGSVEIIGAIVTLGKALGMKVLAEGVESEEQMAVLRAEGCDELQGYLFSRPAPYEDVAGIIESFRSGNVMAGARKRLVQA
jgi:diguanylate cyclase (GGDEF)-like protein